MEQIEHQMEQQQEIVDACPECNGHVFDGICRDCGLVIDIIVVSHFTKTNRCRKPFIEGSKPIAKIPWFGWDRYSLWN